MLSPCNFIYKGKTYTEGEFMKHIHDNMGDFADMIGAPKELKPPEQKVEAPIPDVMRDDKGEPITFYHGTSRKGITELEPSSAQQFGKGIYFGSDKNADAIQDFGDNGQIFEVHLPSNLIESREYHKIVSKVESETGIDPASDKFPLEKVNDEIKKRGYKGIIMDNDLYGGKEVMVFDKKDVVYKKAPIPDVPLVEDFAHLSGEVKKYENAEDFINNGITYDLSTLKPQGRLEGSRNPIRNVEFIGTTDPNSIKFSQVEKQSYLEDVYVEQLVNDINNGKKLNPIIIKPSPLKEDGFILVDGNHRLNAYKKAGKDVPILIQKSSRVNEASKENLESLKGSIIPIKDFYNKVKNEAEQKSDVPLEGEKNVGGENVFEKVEKGKVKVEDLSPMERFVEDNYEGIARELKAKKLLDAPCL